MYSNFTLPEIYIPTKGSRNTPDISKQWFVYYHYKNPDTGESRRFKVYEGINRYKTVSDRLKFAKALKKTLTDLLINDGYNPFTNTNRIAEDLSNLENGIEHYLKYKESLVSASTLAMTRSRLTAFGRFMKDHYPSMATAQITPKIIHEFLESLTCTETVKTGKTLNLYRGVISTFFNFLIYQELDPNIKSNPVKVVVSRKVIKKGNRPYTDTEFQAILDHTSRYFPFLNRMIRFVYYSCMRPGKEARLCQVKHLEINPKGNRILIPALNSKTGHVLGAPQYIPMDPYLLELLQEWNVFEFPPDFYLFSLSGGPGPKPINVNYWTKPFARVRKYLHLEADHTLYSAKHTRICHLFLDGHNFEEIRKLTRHTNNAVLMDYMKGLGLMLEENQVFKSRKI